MSQRPRARRRLAPLLGSLLLLSGLLPVIAVPVAAATPIFINEIHYDNTGTDAGEAIEIAGPARTDLTGWSIVLYNGSGGAVYDTDAFSGTIVDAGSGFGTAAISYPSNGIQNGAPDGIALVNGSTVVQFLSYEGTFTAADGPAVGMASTDIGVSEVGTEAIGTSIGLTGTGTTYEDFTWTTGLDDSFGDPNPGQSFGAAPPVSAVINEFSASTAGTDVEYVELLGPANRSLSTLTVLEIEGDGAPGAGTVDEVISLGSTDADGFLLVNLGANSLENGTISLLLVRDFTGALGSDLDTNDDGTFDTTPWSELVDAVAVNDGGAGDLTYGPPTLGVAYDGQPFAPGGASRIPDGTDTDTTADWVRNDFDLAGIPGFDGTPVFGEAFNTPGASNEAVPSEGHSVVINEIDYDQPSTDTAEYLELKNVGESALSLDAFSVELVNGNAGGAVVYQTIDLPAVSLASMDYFVICANAATTVNCDLDVGPDTNLIQNGAPDAVGLRFGMELVDAVSYEGNTGAPYTEGSGVGLEDTAGVGESISRCPDGADSDVNNVDFALRPSTPGTENDCGGGGGLELGACGDAATFIHDIQGSGLTSPLNGTQVVIEGIVVGDFQNNASADSGELNGFYVQEEDGQADADAATSEGIFVFAPSAPDIAVGDLVRVLGTAVEFGSAGTTTELTNVTGTAGCSTGNPLPAATTVTLPVTEPTDFEPFEGMRVTFPQDLVIAEYFNYDRFGELVLALPLDGESRPFTATAIDEPGAAANARTLANSLRRITLDDGLTVQNPEVTRHPNGDPFSLTNRFRGGDTVADAVGVIDESFGLYRIQPTGPADYTSVNPRPAAPEDVGGTLKAAAMNTLNYFITADYPSGNPLDNACGPLQNVECRGWDFDQSDEFTRQRTKLLQALAGLDADIIGLNEVENTPGVDPTADLAAGLNDLGFGPYASIATGTIGTDAIKVGLIYRTDAVAPVGAFKILDSSVDPRFIDTKSRPVLAQTFEDLATGARITVAVNHLKSKGSDCNDVGDPDVGDGQGNCNLTRTKAARALVDWLATDPTGSGDRDYLILGDLNSYAQEDPIDAIKAGPDDVAGTADDYTNLVQQFIGTYAYSYVFDGQAGYLDHALASPTLTSQVTGVAEWHINADEPDLLDYDTSFKSASQDALYEPNQYRTSDHDPIIVGLNLTNLAFGGFGPPVGDPPAVTTARAGSTVPVKFSLGAGEGLDVLFEAPRVYLCSGWPLGPNQAAQSADGLGLTYDPVTGQYRFEWKSQKSYANTCRTFEITLTDGTFRLVNVTFTR